MYIQYCVRDRERNMTGNLTQIAIEPIEFLSCVHPGKLSMVLDHRVHVVVIQGCGIVCLMREMLSLAGCRVQHVQTAMGGDPKNMAIVFLNARNFH